MTGYAAALEGPRLLQAFQVSDDILSLIGVCQSRERHLGPLYFVGRRSDKRFNIVLVPGYAACDHGWRIGIVRERSRSAVKHAKKGRADNCSRRRCRVTGRAVVPECRSASSR